MEEYDVSYVLENEQQFWDELEDILSADCQREHHLIDSTLRSYLHFTSNFKDDYLGSQGQMRRCSDRLLQSKLYTENKEYVILQLVFSLLQEDESSIVHIIASVLLGSGKKDELTFECMNDEGCFMRILNMIKEECDDNPELHRLMLELMYEMLRGQRLLRSALEEVDDEFVTSLFRVIEQLSSDIDDPYHYPVIRVLLVLNEQYMVASTSSPAVSPATPLGNRVIGVLSNYGSSCRTFGENIILLLNRETETSLQLLILKLLYLLFTTKATQEYFYTNDLRVLLDVIIRNLLDLPNELLSLRHTYLRVLYPLLAYTQLSRPPYYKSDEVLRTLASLGGGGSVHFAPADETTVRLVHRVAQVPWLCEADDEYKAVSHNDVAQKLLGMSISPSHAASAISFVDLAVVHADPGVQTPSRRKRDVLKGDEGSDEITKTASEEAVKLNAAMAARRAPPAVPPSRHVGGIRKAPPQAPPRRRTRLKAVETSEERGDGSIVK